MCGSRPRAAVEPRRRLLLRHEQAGGRLTGLQIEKEVSLVEGSPSVEVVVRVRNTSAETRHVSLRAQQCLPPGRGVFSWPAKDHVRVPRPDPNMLKASIDIADLREGWLACADPATDSGIAMVFDQKQSDKALLYLSPDLNTLEWYYRPVDLPSTCGPRPYRTCGRRPARGNRRQCPRTDLRGLGSPLTGPTRYAYA